jgi:hypothetical protein
LGRQIYSLLRLTAPPPARKERRTKNEEPTTEPRTKTKNQLPVRSVRRASS